jgi:type IV pilus assembly protein PilB
MVDPRLETADKIGYTLLRKGIIDVQTLEKALDAKANDVNKIKRNLAQILVEDFKYDHDTVFAEVASLYAFRDFDTIAERYTDEKIEELKKYIKSLPDSLQQLMALQKVIPLLFDPVIKDKMILGAVDPTNKKISKIAFDLKAKKYEVTFIKKAKYEKLVSHINPVENEFLKNIEDLPQEMITDSPDDSQLDEEALEAEINKSALINLIEAALVEGTRKGVSDIHIVPAGAKRTDLMFRIDCNLQIWYTQENTYP